MNKISSKALNEISKEILKLSETYKKDPSFESVIKILEKNGEQASDMNTKRLYDAVVTLFTLVQRDHISLGPTLSLIGSCYGYLSGLSEIVSSMTTNIPDVEDRAKLEKKLRELEKHKPNLEWLDKRLQDESKTEEV